MSDLPQESGFTDSPVPVQSVGRQKWRDWLGWSRESPWGDPPEVVQIVADAITPAAKKPRFILLDCEGAATTDDLVTIATTNVPNGGWLVLAVAAGQTVNLKTTGNLRLLYGDTTLQLNTINQIVVCRRDLGNFQEIFRSGLEAKRGVSLAANWANGAVVPKCWKDAVGYVQGEGMVVYAGTLATDSLICTLPTGYGPSASQVWLPVVRVTGLDVQPIKVTGLQVWYEGQAGATNPILDLSGIRFRQD